MSIEPEGLIHWQQDPWANRVARVTFEGISLRSFVVRVDAAFDLRPLNPFDFFTDDRCKTVPFVYPDGLERELAPFRQAGPPSEPLADFLESVPYRGSTIDYLVALNRSVADRVRYIIRNEPGIQTSEETLRIGSGSCRDSAVLLVDALRARGLAARFVSGYLIQLRDDGNIPGERKGVSRDVIDLHAWAEVYLPGAGWVGLDGTSGLLTGEGHIPLASAIQPELAAAISGTASLAAERFLFSMDVERLTHEPTARHPYTDAQWESVLRAGDAADAALDRAGVVLTSGGEPTWTSRAHPEQPEWETEALGETKLAAGLAMAAELQERLGQGALVLRSSGKQYPGESLPRWALRILFRRDGVPIWHDPSLQAVLSDGLSDGLSVRPGPAEPPADTVALSVDAPKVTTFRKQLVEHLAVEDCWVAGYEDPWHFARHEQDLPADLDVRSLQDAPDEARRRLASTLRRGLSRPVGYVLPLQWWAGRFITSRWAFRGDQMFLVPGDSPMGLRLPLDRLPGRSPLLPEVDPVYFEQPLRYAPADALPAGSPQQAISEQLLDEGGVLRTALCLETRDGVLHAFVPPMSSAEGFLALIAQIENAAKDAGLPVRVEGYPPPTDPRIETCMVTPDPGVIEVNMPVARSFRQHLRYLDLISDAANHAGLTTEKFQLDGRATGSGGGNHITLGGPTPLSSPFLTRPELLPSLLTYVQHHPALSYLFTGLFVGPTSQAPRIDEARHDSLDEVELAFAQLPADLRAASPSPPWLIDRLLRNLLVDVSGNTHRTEICIDKLYAPEGPSGRQGLVELRAFEMPPHMRMAAVQVALLRCIVARLLHEPYRKPLVRFGTALHDRYMLPYYLAADIRDVAEDLTRFGFAVEPSFFVPFLDYRFPVMGRLELDGVELELRSALEPWTTLGETPVGPAVARYVDSSLERLQLRVVGAVGERYKVTVNGFEVPLHPTRVQGERIAGIRFRAWQPPHCLQPTIPVHHPLRFDVVDTWAERSLGGCQYHVWHPHGRGFDQPPLTASEAAARRAQRFTREGHAPHPARPIPTTPHPSHPLTLDLRRWSRANRRDA